MPGDSFRVSVDPRPGRTHTLTPALKTVFQEMCACACACAHVYVCVNFNMSLSREDSSEELSFSTSHCGFQRLNSGP